MTTDDSSPTITPDATQTQIQTGKDEYKSAYIVGVTQDDQFVFDFAGTDIGLVELLGLHAFAGHRIQKILSQKEGTGDSISKAILHKLQEGVLVMQQADTDEEVTEDVGD